MAYIVMVLKDDIRYDGRVRKEINTLVTLGHQVELIVSDFSKTCSGGEELGVKIHYIPMTLRKNASWNFVEHLVFNYKAASIVKTLHTTHIHCHDLASLLAGVYSKGKIKAKLVYDAHELKPESIKGIRSKIWNFIEGVCIKKCNYIIMPEKNRIAYFEKKYPNIVRPLLLENFPRKCEIPTETFDLFRSIFPIKKSQKIILYTGIISSRRYIEELIESMTMCSEDLVLVILGRTFRGYREKILGKIESLGLCDRVFLHKAVPHTEILWYMASADIGIAFYRNSNINNYYCASNKLYEYIALEKIVLTNNYPGLIEAVEKFKQGICLAEITPKSLAEAYASALNSSHLTPGKKKFFWEDQKNTLVQLYE